MAGSLDGRPPDVQRASQPGHEEGQGSKSPIARTYENAHNHPSASKSCPDSLHSSRRTIWMRCLVGPERD